MTPLALLLIYCLLILLASLAGGWIPLWIRLTHRRMQICVSLVAGVMLGVGLLHLLPHAILEAPDAMNTVFLWVLIGFLTMFFVERFFCFHHHDVPHIGEEGADHGKHDHAAEVCPHIRSDSHKLTWSGAAVGLTLHTIFGGIALAAAVESESHAGAAASLAGLGTFLVIFLHKPFDAMTISTLMTVGGWSMAARHVVNGLFALMIPLGVVLFHLGMGHVHGESNVLAYALAFSAGTFLCIAMADLLPELHFHDHDRAALSAAMIAGLAVAFVIGMVESGSHGHSHGAGEQTHESPAEEGADQQLHGAEDHDHTDHAGHDHPH